MAAYPLRVGIVGYGYFAEFHVKAWQRLASVSLQALAEPNPDRQNAARNAAPQIEVYESVEKMLLENELDIVDVATPPTTHSKLIRPMLGQVRAVICQKPFCENLSRARNLALAAEASTTTLIVHENFRFQPWYREIRDILSGGRIGRVVQASFRLRPGDGATKDAYLDRQPYFRQMEQFLVRETGIHWIDVFRFLFGEPVAVSADLFRTNPVIAGEDSGTFTFQMADGARIVFDGNRTLDHVAQNRRMTMGEFLIEGTSASLSLSGDGEIKLRNFGSNDWRKHPYSFEDRDFGGDCVYQLQKHVADHLSSDTLLENTATNYLKNLDIQESIYRASDDGIKISLGSGRGAS